MNDFLIKMLASQLNISPEVLDQMKRAKVRLVESAIEDDAAEVVTMTLEVAEPEGKFPVIVSLPTNQLKRIPAIYERVMLVAYRTSN